MKAPFKIPSFEIKDRITSLQKALIRSKMDGMLLVQRVDLLYFAGTAQNGFLYVPAEGDPLLLIKRYAPRAKEESSIANIIEITGTRQLPQRIMDVYGRLPDTLAFELDVIPVTHFHFYRDLLPAKAYLDGSPLIHEVRSVKSPWEIEQMGNTARLSAKTFDFIQAHLKPGYTEMEFAGMFEAYARKIGHGGKLRVRDYQSEVYPWHVLSGQSGGKIGLLDSPFSGEGTSLAFPVGAGFRKMAAHEPILIDMGFIYNGYHMDETRMFSIGTMRKTAMDASLAAIEIHDTILEAVKPGLPINFLFETGARKAKDLGYAETYLGPSGYKVSFVGHSIGLDLVEPPIISDKNTTLLKPGMTLSIEPKMNFKDDFGTGIESVFSVTENGFNIISQVPKKVFIV